MSNPKVELHIAGYGVVTLELDQDKAPKTVANFLDYVNKGHYNNTIFHRVIPGFMVQGGGFEPGMKEKPTGAPVENEANNGLKNDNYTVAMARTQAPHSASAQFFINVADNQFLNHTAPERAGLGLRGVRQGRRRHRRGRPHQGRQDRPQGLPRRRADAGRGDRKGRRALKRGGSAMPAVPAFAQLQAPPSWRTIDFISDLHLQAMEPATFDAWRRYMQQTPADAVFILGDLFDVWVGDDAAAAPGFAADCAAVLQAGGRAHGGVLHARQPRLPGRRRASCKPAARRRCRIRRCSGFDGRRWLLTHGDALCLADVDYMQFRQQVRAPAWQQEFLSKPLAQRQAIATDLRERSEARKRSGIGIPGRGQRRGLRLAGGGRRAGADSWPHPSARRSRPGRRPAHCPERLGRRWPQPPRLQVLRLTGEGLRRIALT